MMRYVMSALALKAFSFNKMTKSAYRAMGNIVGERLRILPPPHVFGHDTHTTPDSHRPEFEQKPRIRPLQLEPHRECIRLLHLLHPRGQTGRVGKLRRIRQQHLNREFKALLPVIPPWKE